MTTCYLQLGLIYFNSNDIFIHYKTKVFDKIMEVFLSQLSLKLSSQYNELERMIKMIGESIVQTYIKERNELYVELHNDVSERAFQLERGGTWDKGKGCDSFAPMGPWLVTKDEISNPHKLRLWLSVNGKMMQDGNTDDLIFNIPQLVSYCSQFMTLLPGDVISTGTPAGVGLGFNPNIYLKPGDEVALGIDGLGSSKQTVVAYPSKN